MLNRSLFARTVRYLRRKTMPTSGWYQVKAHDLQWRLNLDRYIDREIARFGTFEETTTDIFQTIIQPGMHVVDIGANIGYYTLLAAHLVGKQGHVTAFEPTSVYWEQLDWHIHNNDFDKIVEVVHLGLSERPGQSLMHTDSISSTMHVTAQRDGEESSLSTIELTTLDDYVRTNNFSALDLIKIDVDGHELQAFTGGAESIAKFCPILLVEFNQASLRSAGTDSDILRAWIEARGYTLYSEQSRTPYRDLLHFTTECANEHFSVNVWAIPKRFQALADRIFYPVHGHE